jgi:hypothetical protein
MSSTGMSTPYSHDEPDDEIYEITVENFFFERILAAVTCTLARNARR